MKNLSQNSVERIVGKSFISIYTMGEYNKESKTKKKLPIYPTLQFAKQQHGHNTSTPKGHHSKPRMKNHTNTITHKHKTAQQHIQTFTHTNSIRARDDVSTIPYNSGSKIATNGKKNQDEKWTIENWFSCYLIKKETS